MRFFKNLDKNRTYQGSELLLYLVENYLAFSWGCCIKFENIKDLRFANGIMAEDALFAPILLVLSQNVGILEERMYHRRIRHFSITDFDNKHTSSTMPFHTHDIFEVISNVQDAKEYYLAYSNCVICLKLDEFIQNSQISQKIKDVLQALVIGRIPMAFYSLSFRDVRNCKKMCKRLMKYSKSIGYRSKLAFYAPWIYRPLKKIKNLVSGMK